MQTILGAGGIIGTEIAKTLREQGQARRLVSRRPQALFPDDQLLPADLTDAAAVRRAVAGSEVVYLTAGLPYLAKTWEAQWPRIMQNTLDACAAEGARLVFFDNIYMYAPSETPHLSEAARVAPLSRKGQVRAQIAQMLMAAVEKGRVEALIARSADFYGPGIRQNSILQETVFKPLLKGQTANWLGRDDVPHSFTYTPDAGRASVLLGNSPAAYGQIWHLPTANPAPTGREWVAQIAAALGKPARHRKVPKTMVRLLGLALPIMRETVEMMYQYEQPYVFDSQKIEQAFGLRPTPYAEGIRAVAADMGA